MIIPSQPEQLKFLVFVHIHRKELKYCFVLRSIDLGPITLFSGEDTCDDTHTQKTQERIRMITAFKK